MTLAGTHTITIIQRFVMPVAPTIKDGGNYPSITLATKKAVITVVAAQDAGQ